MTPLRQKMIDDLRLRGHSPRTIEAYVSAVKGYARFHKRSPDRLGPEAVREYQLHLINSGASWSRFNQVVCALKFLYRVTLKVEWPVEEVPYGRKRRDLPVVLSQEEVVGLIEAVAHPVCRMALLTAYAAGLRITETVSLKAEHVDSARMMIHVEMGKGQKPRMVPLSEVLLKELRTYWRSTRPKVAGSPWLFPGAKPGKPIDVTTIQKACQHARAKVGLKKHATPHTLSYPSSYYP